MRFAYALHGRAQGNAHEHCISGKAPVVRNEAQLQSQVLNRGEFFHQLEFAAPGGIASGRNADCSLLPSQRPGAARAVVPFQLHAALHLPVEIVVQRGSCHIAVAGI